MLVSSSALYRIQRNRMINSPRTHFPHLKAPPILASKKKGVLANAKLCLAMKMAAAMNAFLSNYEFFIS